MIHLSLLIRKLSRTITGSRVHHRRRHDLQVTGITSLIQEEVDQRTLQTSALSFIDRETCSRDLNTQIEINQIIFLRQFPVRKSVLRKFRFHTSHFLNYIVLGTNTFGHTVVGNIGNGIQQIQHVVGSLVHVGLQCFIALLYLGYTGFCNFSFFLFAFFHQLTDRFRK